MSRLLVILTIIVTLFLFTGPVQAEPRSYNVGERGSLQLDLPDSWEQTVHQQETAPPIDIALRGRDGGQFQVYVQLLWDPGNPSGCESSWARGATEAAFSGVADQVVEDRAELLPLNGEVAQGFYFVATDRNPTPGPEDFRHIVQGVVCVAHVAVTFTLLTNDLESTEVRALTSAITHASLR